MTLTGELPWRLKNHQAAAWNFRKALSLAQVNPEQAYLARLIERADGALPGEKRPAG